LYSRSALSCGVSCEISGPRTVVPGANPDIPEPGVVRKASLPVAFLPPYAPPARYAMNAVIAIPAIIHGSGDGFLAGESCAPQLAQKRPGPGVEHAGQTTSGFPSSFIAYNLNQFAVAIQAGEASAD